MIKQKEATFFMKKILIVEDDQKLRNELKIYLEKNGYEALTIEKFDNSIQDILDKKADLILLDINLPYLDGEYICKEIRKTSNVPIIMVTSRDSELDELISLNYGADQYVTKPYNIQILLAKIAGLLKRTENTAINQKGLRNFLCERGMTFIQALQNYSDEALRRYQALQHSTN